MNPAKFTALALSIPLFNFCMEETPFKHRALEQYPNGLGFMRVEDVLTTIDPTPEDIKETLDVSESCYTKYMAHPKELSRNMISSLGYGPYEAHPADLPAYKGPIIHDITIAIAQKLLEKLGSKKIVPVPTWLCHLPEYPEELDDRNYLVVQTKIPKRFKALALLDSVEKRQFIQEFDIEEFYEAIRYIHYAFPDENNVCVDTDDLTIRLLRTISPDNEGLGTKAWRGKAILGQDLGKALFNVRNDWDGGHRTFENIIKKYGDNDDVDRWNELYSNDPIFKK